MLLVVPCRVGVRGLELPTSTSRTWRANQLCYTPIPCFGAAKVLLFLELTIKNQKKLHFGGKKGLFDTFDLPGTQKNVKFFDDISKLIPIFVGWKIGD